MSNNDKKTILGFTRQLVIDHLHNNNATLNSLAKETNIAQPNLHVFINGKGLSVKSVDKLWNYFGVKRPVKK